MICEPEENENIEDAAYVYWSQEILVDNFLDICVQEELQSSNPETLLIMKDTFMHTLSKECLIVAQTIADAPDEIFFDNGKIKGTKLKNILKIKTGWSFEKIERVVRNFINQLLEVDSQRTKILQNF